MITDALTEAGVCWGIDDHVVQQVVEGLSRPDFKLDSTVVASAKAPIPGTDGELEMAFEVGIRSGLQREDGTLDYHDRNYLTPVDKGTVLATYRPPEVAVEGTVSTVASSQLRPYSIPSRSSDQERSSERVDELLPRATVLCAGTVPNASM